MNIAPASRLLTGLLVASLLGNAALLFVLKRRPAATVTPASDTPAVVLLGAAPAVRHADAESAPGEVVTAEAAAVFKSLDAGRLNALLLAAGVDSELRIQFVQILLWKKYDMRHRAIDSDQGEETLAVWWKEPGGRDRFGSPEERERNLAYSRLNEEMAAELKSVTGIDPDAFEPEKNAWLAREYGGLPREKAAALFRIGRDYDALENELRNESGDFELPEDEAKLQLLKNERERDIAALLTPEERTEWELRNSDTASQLRQRMTQLDASEEEYRRIYTLQKAFDAEFSLAKTAELISGPDGVGAEFWERQEAARAVLEDEIRAIVGEERYAAAALENDPDFTHARSAAGRLGLPADTARRLLALREPAAAESRRIAADSSLNLDQKKAALARIAADTRAQVVETLGPAAEPYFKRGAMNWLDHLERGTPIRFKSQGGYETIDSEP